MKPYILTLTLLIIPLLLQGQRLSVDAPHSVPAGENFRVSYTLNTNSTNENLHIGAIPSGLEITYGPAISTQESFRVINGHTSSSSSTTFTYTMIATRPGTYTIPAAHINVEGRKISSSTVRIQATSPRNRGTTQNGPRFYNEDQQADRRQQSRQSATTSGKDLFIRVSANKRKVHEQEPILLTYKVYTTVDLTELQGKMPDLKGFHVQEIPLPQQKSFHTETAGGQTYRCVTWSQYVMYPQQTGTLEIPSITFKGTVVKRNHYVDPFEEFFNGGSGYTEQRREIEAPAVSIQVEPLPEKPKNFSGAVGHFNISAQADRQQLKTGEPLTVRIIINGSGNMKLMKAPEISFPKDFERYDVKTTDKTRLTSNGVEGNMIYDCLAVPTHSGKYTLPKVDFTYYDTHSNSYRTISTSPITIEVEQGEGNVSIADYSKADEGDIHAIHTGKAHLMRQGDFFFLSVAYWIWFILPLILFCTLLYMFRRRALMNANTILMREKKAEKVANRRLNRAAQLMTQNRSADFYDEVLRTLWGYTSDKLNMPSEHLSRDNVRETFIRHGIEPAIVDKFIAAIDECEFERYSPTGAQGNMQRTYEASREAIMSIENNIKKGRKKPTKRVSATYMLAATAMLSLSIALPTQAVTKENADTEYAKGNYQQAIIDYEELLKQGADADIYYNLGNAYYRTADITRALLNYERALLLAPGNADIRHNLQVAQTKTIDKIPPESEMFFITWSKSFVNLMSVDQWAGMSIILIAAALLMLLVYLFGERMYIRKTGFFGSIILLALFAIATVCAYIQRHQLTHRNSALVVTSSATVRRTPDKNAAEIFTLHEGTKVRITDKTMPQWRAVRISDGRKGWIETARIEEI